MQRNWKDLAARLKLSHVFDLGLLLVVGAVAAMAWANLAPESYFGFLHTPWLTGLPIGSHAPDGGRFIDFHYIVTDVLMALFFALAAKEVWTAMLPGGALHQARRAALPIVCAVAGMAFPAAFYAAGASLAGPREDLLSGWAVPTATDVTFSYLAARIILGKGHPAIAFLLLLAVADDAMGLAIIGMFYRHGVLNPEWFALCIAAMGVALVMRMHRLPYWAFLLGPGALSWLGIELAGIHPALGLLPIIPFIPHLGSGGERISRGDGRTELERFEHHWNRPVEAIQGLFALANAGVVMTGALTFSPVFFLVLGGLVVGKPLGIWVCAYAGTRYLGLLLPSGISLAEIAVVGSIAGIGFTVSILVSTLAFADGPLQDAAKLGAVASLVSAPIAFALARIVGVRRKAKGGNERSAEKAPDALTGPALPGPRSARPASSTRRTTRTALPTVLGR